MTLLSLFLGIGNFGGTEILLIVIAIILLFGAKRIPELAKGLGKGIREFKDATKEEKPEYRDRPVNPNDPTQPRL
ncbi:MULTISPECIES: twin-arginine translocase TatA/TatE family subunit [Hymenobacter]|uniref:Sec-independent protein translocase protein TatA n=1 Tax=Hymenobacter jejuensis TaxID=2502781 RepID=A0A5B8A053_9BACT|nr:MULTISPECIES: twin-arginine translocase TatA/TatE family subunit [Hymenobacter]MBC6990994.1 twin-arginine translocase TatA/TatE family subunit [Hymenobacter sp. BT491]QDA60608.1 twin-arginine translocase TatA/TatE family subunit [Hymenobacter jejuensis]